MNVNSIFYAKDSLKMTNGRSGYVEGANRTAGTLGIQDFLIKSIKRSRQHSWKASGLLHPLSSVSTSRPSCNIDRIFSVGIDRGIARRSPRKRLPGEGKVIGNTCLRGYRHVTDALSFYGQQPFFMRIGRIGRWTLQEEEQLCRM